MPRKAPVTSARYDYPFHVPAPLYDVPIHAMTAPTLYDKPYPSWPTPCDKPIQVKLHSVRTTIQPVTCSYHAVTTNLAIIDSDQSVTTSPPGLLHAGPDDNPQRVAPGRHDQELPCCHDRGTLPV
jgi:hypothetical protein